MNLSEHFTLEEFTHSTTAIRLGIDNTPSSQVIDNLRGLCNALEIIRSEIGKPIIITSGYRCEALNKAVKGSKNSFHLRGCAADIKVAGWTAEKLYDEILEETSIFFNEVFNEFDNWVHVAVDGKSTKNARGKYTYSEGKKIYIPDENY